MGQIFVSYSRDDGERAEFKGLLKDLDRVSDAVWRDEALKGGQCWWNEILDQIRHCTIFLTVASTTSLQSEACRSELRYAVDLKRPLLCVKIDPIDEDDLPSSIALTEVVDYALRAASADAGADCLFSLQGAVTSMQAEPVPDLPDPVPAPPEAPGSYRRELRDMLDADELSFAEQQEFLHRVRARSNDRSRESLADLLELVDDFASRLEISRQAADEATEVAERLRRSLARAQHPAHGEPDHGADGTHEPDPVESIPIELSAVESAPVGPVPVEAIPVESAPVEPKPVEAVPAQAILVPSPAGGAIPLDRGAWSAGPDSAGPELGVSKLESCLSEWLGSSGLGEPDHTASGGRVVQRRSRQWRAIGAGTALTVVLWNRGRELDSDALAPRGSTTP